MDVIEKIKREHADLLARQKANEELRQKALDAELARLAEPIRKQLNWSLFSLLVEELGPDASAAMDALVVELPSDTALTEKSHDYHTVWLKRDGMASLRLRFRAETFEPMEQQERYGLNKGIYGMWPLWVNDRGEIRSRIEADEEIRFASSFGEAITRAETEWQEAVRTAERRRASDAKPKIDDGGYAFPSGEEQNHGGMTLRDYFAGQAIAALIKAGHAESHCAKTSYRLADEMIQARKS